MNWSIKKNGVVLKTGAPCDIREVIEEMLEEKLGFFLSLQEDEDEGFIYLHSEYYEDITEAQVETTADLGISENYDEETKKVIEHLLDISIITA